MTTETELCSKCGKKKRRQGLTSFTQWIFDSESCACDRFATTILEESVRRNFCLACGLPISSGRSGSMTQWIFASGSCGCEHPVIHTDNPVAGGGVPGTATFDDNEPELVVDDGVLPTERYKVKSELGRGASGVVYLCRDKLLDVEVAVKTLRRLTNDELIAFQTEARATNKLNHPSILKLLDFGPSASGSPYMVLEYFDGISLEAYLERNPPLSLWQSIEIFEDLADALSVAHQAKIFHRDLKPSNVLIRLSERQKPIVKLIDFGVAKIKEDSSGISALPGRSVAGTPAYMPPDTFVGGVYDERSEVYSLGCLMFHCLTGRPPFYGENPLDVLKKHSELAPPSLTSAFSEEVGKDFEFPEKLESIISKCLSKSQSDRFSSMQELKSAVTTAAQTIEAERVARGKNASTPFHSGAETAGLAEEGRRSSFSRWVVPAAMVSLTVVSLTLTGAYFGGVFNTGSKFDSTAKKLSGKSLKSAGGIGDSGSVVTESGGKYGNPGNASHGVGTAVGGPAMPSGRATIGGAPAHQNPLDEESELKHMSHLEGRENSDAVLESRARQGDARAAYTLAQVYYNKGQTNPEDFKKQAYWNKISADLGYPKAANSLGVQYLYGLGVKQDSRQAAMWYEKALKSSRNPMTVCNLALLYRDGNGVKQDSRLAYKMLEEAANTGYGAAQNHLGHGYMEGLGTPKNYEKAFYWLQKSAQAGCHEALTNLGMMYLKGLGIEKNYGCAKKLFERAAQRADFGAINSLAYLYENGLGVNQDCAKAMELYKRSADMGYPVAMNNIGFLYLKGKGVKQDPSEAVKWFKKGAEREDPTSLNNLGQLHLDGVGVPVDYKAAMGFYRRAAACNQPLAKCNIGTMYHRGLGVKVDYKEAMKWYREAADGSLPDANRKIGLLYKGGFGVKQDYNEALKYFKLAAESGDSPGCEYLAELYEEGLGVPVNYKLMLKYRRKAMMLGNPEAYDKMGLVYQNGVAVPKDLQRAKKFFMRASDLGSKEGKEHLLKIQDSN